MFKVKITGIKQLQKALKENVTLDQVKQLVRTSGTELQAEVQKHSRTDTFNKGYSQGDIMRDVGAQGYKEQDNGLTVEVGTTKEYGPYLEYGTRFMGKEQFIKPSLDVVEPKFKDRMQKLVK